MRMKLNTRFRVFLGDYEMALIRGLHSSLLQSSTFTDTYILIPLHIDPQEYKGQLK